jgi:hypothetical protein
VSDDEELPAVDVWLTSVEGFPAPQWQWLIDWQEGKSNRTKNRLAIFVVDEWAEALCTHLGHGYEIISSKHFLVVSGRPSREGDVLVSAMELALERIAKKLPGIAEVRPSPKYSATLFADHATFLEYVSIDDPEEGEFGHPGGLFIPTGLGHFVLPADSLRSLESSITHELTHAMVSHLALPSWIDEGLAQSMELAAGLRHAPVFDREAIEEHRNYWNLERLEEFWAGRSFKSIEGQRLSYSLAEFVLNALPGDPQRLTEFVVNAKFEDSGYGAARSILGIELEELIAPLVPTLADRDEESR